MQLVVEPPDAKLTVDLDRMRVRQVLLNLLTNAMRSTEAGWVRVSTTLCATEITVTVADSGRGIAPEKLARAFEAFDRLDEEQLSKGSGLGLAVSKQFVNLHEGRMWIESEVGRGTAVSFTLPLPTDRERLPLGTLHLSQPLRQAAEQPTVLVLNDDPRTLALLRRHIDNCDFVLAENAVDASQLMTEVFPSAVLVDAASAERWDEVTETLAGTAQIPVLICPLPNMHHVGALLGATDYLPKPVMREDLALVLRQLPHPPRTALVVDDDPHIVRLLGRMLHAIAPELRVLEAFGGEEGLALARSHHPDVIFVDLMMPGITGQRFIEIASGDAALCSIPIIVVSVRSVEQEAAPIMGELRLSLRQAFRSARCSPSCSCCSPASPDRMQSPQPVPHHF